MGLFTLFFKVMEHFLPLKSQPAVQVVKKIQIEMLSLKSGQRARGLEFQNPLPRSTQPSRTVG